MLLELCQCSGVVLFVCFLALELLSCITNDKHIMMWIVNCFPDLNVFSRFKSQMSFLDLECYIWIKAVGLYIHFAFFISIQFLHALKSFQKFNIDKCIQRIECIFSRALKIRFSLHLSKHNHSTNIFLSWAISSKISSFTTRIKVKVPLDCSLKAYSQTFIPQRLCDKVTKMILPMIFLKWRIQIKSSDQL
mgnify:FL=1